MTVIFEGSTGNAFRLSPGSGANMNDIQAQVAGGWTLGAALIDAFTLPGPRSPSAKYVVTGYAVQAMLQLSDTRDMAFHLGQQAYGKFGRIIAGLTNLPPTNPPGQGQLFVRPVGTLPDPTLTADLWNPARDPLPPLQRTTESALEPSPISALPVDITEVLSQPVDITSGSGVQGIGIWITPSLLSTGANASPPQPCMAMTVWNARYSIAYRIEDGS